MVTDDEVRDFLDAAHETADAIDDLGPMTLADLLVHVEHVLEDVDLADEQATAIRQRLHDDAMTLRLHAIGDNLTRAWGYLGLAHQGLREALREVPRG